MSLCLASAGVVKTLSIAAFTLVWTHSIEKVEWQEDWRVTSQGLELVQARVKGSGAGMEPPPESVLRDGWWRFHPNLPPLAELRLANSAVGEYTLCWAGGCSALSQLVQGDTIVLWVCGPAQ